MSKRNFHDCRQNRKALAWREGQSLGPMREQMPPTKAGSGKNVQLTCVPVDLRAYVFRLDTKGTPRVHQEL